VFCHGFSVRTALEKRLPAKNGRSKEMLLNRFLKTNKKKHRLSTTQENGAE